MHSRNSIIISLTFFIFWLVVLYLGADHPVPNGFILIIVIDIILALVVYWRSIAYFKRIAKKEKGQTWIAMIEGTLLGFLLSIITLVSNLLGKNSQNARSNTDIVIWIFVLTLLGSINSVCVYKVCSIIIKHKER